MHFQQILLLLLFKCISSRKKNLDELNNQTVKLTLRRLLAESFKNFDKAKNNVDAREQWVLKSHNF